MSSAFQRYRELSLGIKILLSMGIGLALGIIFGERAQAVEPLGVLFIRLLVMAAIPLVFFNLLAGLTSLSDIRVLGRLGAKTFFFTSRRRFSPSCWVWRPSSCSNPATACR